MIAKLSDGDGLRIETIWSYQPAPLTNTGTSRKLIAERQPLLNTTV